MNPERTYTFVNDEFDVKINNNGINNLKMSFGELRF